MHLLDVDHVGALEHGQLHRLAGLVAQRLHRRQRLAADVEARVHAGREQQAARAEAVGRVLVLHDEAARLQRARQAEGRGLRAAGAIRELGRAERPVAGELLEQAQRPVDGGERGSLGGRHGREDSAFRLAAPVYHPGTWRPGHVRASRRPAMSAARRCASRTTRCCAARGGSSTTSTRCPNTGVAAIVRSPFAHARIGEIDASAALALPGVIGVVTGADVAAHSRPFGSALGAGHRPPRRRGRRRPLRRRARLRRRRARPLHRRGRRRARARRLRAAARRGERRGRAGRGRAACCTRRSAPTSPATARSATAIPDAAFARRRARRARALPPPALVGHAGRVLRRDRALAGGRRDGVGELPGALHAARRRGRRARHPRREAAAAHAGRERRLVRHEGGGAALRSC